jgi:hypothetical protein
MKKYFYCNCEQQRLLSNINFLSDELEKSLVSYGNAKERVKDGTERFFMTAYIH